MKQYILRNGTIIEEVRIIHLIAVEYNHIIYQGKMFGGIPTIISEVYPSTISIKRDLYRLFCENNYEKRIFDKYKRKEEKTNSFVKELENITRKVMKENNTVYTSIEGFNGTLKNAIMDKKRLMEEKYLSIFEYIEWVKGVILQILKCINSMQKRGAFLLDLSACNILVNEKRVTFINYSNVIQERSCKFGQLESYHFNSPELILKKEPINAISTLSYELCSLIFELLTGDTMKGYLNTQLWKQKKNLEVCQELSYLNNSEIDKQSLIQLFQKGCAVLETERYESYEELSKSILRIM